MGPPRVGVDNIAHNVYSIGMQDASTTLLTGRVSTELADEVYKITDKTRDPYAPTVSKIVARGVELAVKEYKAKRPDKS